MTQPQTFKYLVICENYGVLGITTDEQLKKFAQLNDFQWCINLETQQELKVIYDPEQENNIGEKWEPINAVNQDWLTQEQDIDDAE